LAKAVGTSEASRRLSIPLKTLANWLRVFNNGKLSAIRPDCVKTPLSELA
jgi:hypothetical protein